MAVTHLNALFAYSLEMVNRLKTKLSNLRVQIQRRIASILFTICLTLYLFLFLDELQKRLSAGIGLSDEGFAILRVQDNQINDFGIENNLFGKILQPLFKLSGQQVYVYRILWIIVVLIVVSLLWNAIRNDLKKRQINSKFVRAIIATLPITILSHYNFLVLTPNYQTILILSSILQVTIFINFHNRSKLSYLILSQLFHGACFTLALFARPTSSLVFLLIPVTGMIKENKFRFILCVSFLSGILIVVFSQFISVVQLVKSLYYTFQWSRSIGSEAFDFSKSLRNIVVLCCLLCIILILVNRTILFATCKIEDTKQKTSILFILLTLGACLFLNHALLFPQPIKAIVILNLVVVAANINFDVKDKYLRIFASTLPISSTLGSSISPFVQWQLIYISIALFAVTFKCNQSKFHPLLEKYLVNVSSILVILLATMLLFAMKSSTYEKTILTNEKEISRFDYLVYSKEKTQKLINWRSNTEKNYNGNQSPVFDFSYFHPSLIWHLRQTMFPYFIADSKFSNSLDRQISFILKRARNMDITPTKFLVESIDNRSILERSILQCEAITKLPVEPKIQKSLMKYFNQRKYRIERYYLRSSEDSSLTKSNILLLNQC